MRDVEAKLRALRHGVDAEQQSREQRLRETFITNIFAVHQGVTGMDCFDKQFEGYPVWAPFGSRRTLAEVFATVKLVATPPAERLVAAHAGEYIHPIGGASWMLAPKYLPSNHRLYGTTVPAHSEEPGRAALEWRDSGDQTVLAFAVDEMLGILRAPGQLEHRFGRMRSVPPLRSDMVRLGAPRELYPGKAKDCDPSRRTLVWLPLSPTSARRVDWLNRTIGQQGDHAIGQQGDHARFGIALDII